MLITPPLCDTIYDTTMNESTLLKKIEKLLSFPPDFSYKDIVGILNYFGFELVNKKGSHNMFVLTKPLPDVDYRDEQITIPTVKGRRVKRFYLKRIAKLLDLEVWHERHKISRES